ncbi:hypothetical protein QMK33_19420 [Hymenobacter sp. H14-R3]|uniref:hypothetical protein n=1 Tax=Hymenobacter sp. H14-R3 TaxID=3046308 RepID=UPI0024BA053A|nr:hypothetical protein [Hymenobacter sp. H14-R3]MDJ0367324.1 hypothetical protein [Hymenobacter sp. H14-R3]
MKAALLTLTLAVPYFCTAQVQPKPPIKAKVVKTDLISPTLMQSLVNPGGAPFSPVSSIAFESTLWANHLQDFVGSIVLIEISPDGNATITQVLNNIKADTTKNRVVPPSLPEIEYKLIDKSTSASISFMGISPSMSNEERYEYNSTTLAISTITGRQVDKTKIPTGVKCNNPANCQYFYVNAASVQTCETTHLVKRGRTLKVDNFPVGVAAVPISGNFYTGNTTSDRIKKNIVFCTLLSLP